MADELMNLPPADAAPVLTLDPMTTQAPVMAELAPKPEEIPEDYRRFDLHRNVCDYIAGMTDRYAIMQFKNIFIPHSWNIIL